LSSTITTSAVYGNSRTVFGGNIIEASKWRYQVINGVNCKITETTKDGKTIMDTASVLSETLTSNLVLNSKKLGWINCDRFYNDNSPRIDVIVKYTGTFAPNVVLVFEDINSVLPYSYREDNKLVFKNIPSDKNIVFVGLYKSKDNDKILFAQKRTKSKDGLVESITFEELSATEVQQKMIAL